MMRILVTYNLFRERFAELESVCDVTFPPEANGKFTFREVSDLIAEYDALCPMFDFPVNSELINKGTRLKLIANYAVGYDNIDVACALSKGLTVTNTPDPVTQPTANLALALLLDVARRISECDRKIRAAGPELKIGLLDNLGLPVSGKTLGIIGMGRIGKALCKRANACGMQVIYHNRHSLRIEEETSLNALYTSKEALLEQADFISLHTPYTPETYHLIGDAELKRMKPTAILINTARGPLVDEKALANALRDGEIAGAGLDVFESGAYPPDELREIERVVLTPHIGTQTMHTRMEMAQAVCNNVIGFFKQDRPISRVLKP
jgi:lactate dehydrogenase-like 2-hydroxyacid dehydrogenase